MGHFASRNFRQHLILAVIAVTIAKTSREKLLRWIEGIFENIEHPLARILT
jgi:Flp pilus assembly pilin Flp